MTAPARLTQADIDRATKAAAKVGARVVLDFDNRRIEIIIGESGPPPKNADWDDDVV